MRERTAVTIYKGAVVTLGGAHAGIVEGVPVFY